MDTHVFASLAHIRILLLPVGSISQAAFQQYASEIKCLDTIRLGDLPENKDEKARFMPKDALDAGQLQLNFISHFPPVSHLPLSLLRPSHFPLAVIGIATCTNNDSLPSILANFNSILLDMYPSDSVYPVGRSCFAFDESDGATNINLGENIQGVAVIPGIMGNKKLYLGTLLADLCSNVIGELALIYQTLESPLGNEYLNATLLPTLSSLSDMPTPLDGDLRRDSLPPLPSHNSQPDMSTPFTLSSAPTMKRNSSLGSAVRKSTLAVPPSRKTRLSGLGAVSSHGRLFKVMADFFLLAGRTEEATVWYNEAIQLFRPTIDSVWHASALEGLATIIVLDAWSAGQGLQTSISTESEPWTNVTEKLIQATMMYSKAPASDKEHNYPLLSYLYCCCVLRHTSLMFAIWSAKGWGPLAFTTMLQPMANLELPPTLSPGSNSWALLERLSSISGISRVAISNTLAQLHGPWLLHLDPRERIGILETTASIYSCIGYRRKEAYILREVLGCVLDLIVCGREEDSASQGLRTRGSASATTDASMSTVPGRGQVGMRLSESIDGNGSLLKLLKYVCRVLGINLEAIRLCDKSNGEEDNGTLSDQQAYENDDLDVHENVHGWPELQIGVVREAVAVAEALPDFPSVAQFSLASLKTLQTVLAPGDQFHFYTSASRALMTAERRGDYRAVEYWSGRPIISITLAPLPLIRLPVEKPLSALDSRVSEHTLLTGGPDPFLYNPRRAQSQGKSLVVQNEILEFLLVLQNPFVFDLEIESLALSTSGPKFESKPVHVIIPARAYHRVTISGRAVDTGNLVIRGCLVQAPGSTLREFILPLANAEEEGRFQRKRSAHLCELDRSKYSGLDAFPWAKVSRRVSKEITSSNVPLRFLECKVVPEQPMLRIRWTTVTRGALMLYNGERSTIRLVVENVSALPIDFLRLVFDDSTIAPAQQALTEGELSVFDTYETEYDLMHRPMFSCEKDEVQEILPGQKLSLTVSCQGKVGCTTGTIHMSYSFVHGRQSSKDTNVFHTRQLSYPLLITVYHMLECNGMDVLPFPSYDPDDVGTTTSSLFVGGDDDWCLFSLDIRNTYGTPFNVVVERTQKNTSSSQSTTTVPPGSTVRVVLPLKKFLLSEEHVSQPIPTLSDRQFVVTKSKLSALDEQLQRQLFWYREELFNSIRCRWQETGGIREGDLSLRKQRLTMHMLETLRTDGASVHMSLVEYDADGVEKAVTYTGGKYFPHPNEYTYLRTKITNKTPTASMFRLNLIMEPLEYVIYEGILSDQPVGELEPGESRTLEMGVAFLARGRFHISANLHTVTPGGEEKHSGGAHLTALIRTE